MVIVGGTFVAILGLLWTKHHYEAAEKAERVDMLDQINQRALQARRGGLRLGPASPNSSPASSSTDAASRNTPPAAATQTAVAYPSDLDESSARKIIGNCAFFRDPRTFEVPRKFPRESYAEMVARYPVLATAAHEHLIEMNPPPGTTFVSGEPDDITVRVTGAAYGQVDVRDDGGETIQLGLGRRRLDSVWVADTKVVDLAILSFTWSYEHPAAAALAGDSWQNHNGAAKLHREPFGGWTLRYAWLDSNHGALYVCP